VGVTSPPQADADATAVELPEQPEDVQPQPAVSTALAPRPRRSEVIRPLNAEQLVQSFAEYQELLPQLLRESDYQEAEQGKKFVKKSGWRKIATAFDLDVRIIAEEVERDEDGRILRSKTTARATSPSGRVMDGDGYCTTDEFTGRRANNPKLENDLRGTAATRAKNRAISDLVGMGEVSAEEVDAGGGASTGLPGWAVGVGGDQIDRARRALAYLLDDDMRGPRVESVGFGITQAAGGNFPGIAVEAIVQVATVLKRHRDVVHDEPTRDPEADAAAEAAIASELGDEPTPETPPAGAPRPAADPEDLPQDPAKRIAALRELGCRCEKPLEQATWRLDCPVDKHSRASDDIPF
jgi:hypothetical protein